jgi:predicted protein tyrosine phosphatase
MPFDRWTRAAPFGYGSPMQTIPFSTLTVCGIEELPLHGSRAVTHVLSILDPEYPEPDAFQAFPAHRRTILRFHDVIEPTPGCVTPERDHVEAILEFGRDSASGHPTEPHLLVHCHAGVSRSTAAMAMLMAQAEAQEDEDRLFARLLAVRAKAWPNSRLIGIADALLGRGGRLSAALGRLYARQLQVFPQMERFMNANGRAREIAMAAQSSLAPR